MRIGYVIAPFSLILATRCRSIMGCLHDPANVQQTSSKCNAGRLLDRVNTLLVAVYL